MYKVQITYNLSLKQQKNPFNLNVFYFIIKTLTIPHSTLFNKNREVTGTYRFFQSVLYIPCNIQGDGKIKG